VERRCLVAPARPQQRHQIGKVEACSTCLANLEKCLQKLSTRPYAEPDVQTMIRTSCLIQRLRQAHSVVSALTSLQFLMRVNFCNLAILHDENDIRMSNSAESMCDDDRCSTQCRFIQRFLHNAFILNIQRRSRFIKQQQARLSNQCFSNCNALSLFIEKLKILQVARRIQIFEQWKYKVQSVDLTTSFMHFLFKRFILQINYDVLVNKIKIQRQFLLHQKHVTMINIWKHK